MNSILIWLQLLDSHGITSLCHILPKSVTYVVVLFCNLSHGDVPGIIVALGLKNVIFSLSKQKSPLISSSLKYHCFANAWQAARLILPVAVRGSVQWMMVSGLLYFGKVAMAAVKSDTAADGPSQSRAMLCPRRG